MQILEKNRGEVEVRASKMSDFLKMEYLENCARTFRDIEILRYCYSELSKLYEKNIMYPEAIKYIEKFQEVCISQREKIQAYIREIELLIKGGFYERVNFAYNKIFETASPKEIAEIETKIINMYKSEAEKFEKSNKNALALRVYERLARAVKDSEKPEIKNKILILYKKLGKVRESIELERELHR